MPTKTGYKLEIVTGQFAVTYKVQIGTISKTETASTKHDDNGGVAFGYE